MDEYTAKYELDGVIYSVSGSAELHERLQSENDFADQYFRENAGAIEIVEVAPESDQEHNFQWTKKPTALLVHLYRERVQRFRDPKQKKKMLWVEMAEQFKRCGYNQITDTILDKKFRNMKKTFRTIKDNNKRTVTGRGRISWDYFGDFNEIFHNDKTVNFGPTISSMPSTSSALPAAQAFIPSTLSSALSTPAQTNQPSTSNTLTSPLSSPSTSSAHSTPPRPNNTIPDSNQFDPDETLRASPTASKSRGKRLAEFRKQMLELENKRVEELAKLRKSIENSNTIQEARNTLLNSILEKM